MSFLSRKLIIAVAVILFSVILVGATNKENIVIKDPKVGCPSVCRCRDQEARCKDLPSDRAFSLPESIKFLTFDTAISCDDANLDRLQHLGVPNYIRVIGRCSQPDFLTGREIEEIIEDTSIFASKSRSKRDAFSTPSIYNFTETPAISIQCNFDSNLCGWVQPKNTDFFDWTRQNGSTVSPFTGPSNDHTQGNGNGFYVHIDASLRAEGEYADLMSPPLRKASDNSNVMIGFYVNSYGTAIGKLQIYVMYPSIEHLPRPVSNVSLIIQKDWWRYETTFRPLYNPYRIIIRGITKNSYRGDIAIDDVSITSIETSCYLNSSEVYRGTANTTIFGDICQSWSSQSPHSHDYTPSKYPFSGLVDNRCRNPGGSRDRPWCYTANPSRIWDYCNIGVFPCANAIEYKASYPLGSQYPVALINLNGGSNRYGRVVIYHSGQWGTICQNHISTHKLDLLCKQAGFTGGGISTPNRKYPGTGKIWLSNGVFSCPSDSTSIYQCTFGPWNGFCNHTDDLWMQCASISNCPACITPNISTILPTYPNISSTIHIDHTTSKPTSVKRYELRLNRGANGTSGYIVIDYNNTAGVICASNWNLRSADVVCRQLGFVNAYSSSPKVDASRPVATKALITDIKCTGYEHYIGECVVLSPPPSSSISCYKAANRVSCNPGQKYYTINNQPDHCEFKYGSCGWVSKGKISWAWHPGNGRHYAPFPTSTTAYMYVIRSPHHNRPINSVLISPLISRRSDRWQYIVFHYYILSTMFDSLSVTYQYNLQGQSVHPLYTISAAQGSNFWHGAATKTFYPTSTFYVKFTVRSNTSDSYHLISGVGIRSIAFHYGTTPSVLGSGPVVNVPAIAIGCSAAILALIILTIYMYKRAHRVRSSNTTITTTTAPQTSFPNSAANHQQSNIQSHNNNALTTSNTQTTIAAPSEPSPPVYSEMLPTNETDEPQKHNLTTQHQHY